MPALTDEEPAVYGVRRTLPDGSPVVVRQLEPDDADLLREVFEQMGPASREARFLAPKPRLTGADVRQLLAVDHVDHEALVALDVADGHPVGIARFVRDPDDAETAEVAIEVVDAWQSRGLGMMLTTALLGRARELGIHRLTLIMARDNRAAAGLMRRSATRAEVLEVDGQTVDYVIHLDGDAAENDAAQSDAALDEAAEPAAWSVLKGA